MKTVTLTNKQITEILEAFSYGKYNHIPCPRGCCWETEAMVDYIPGFIEDNETLLTIVIEESQIKEEN